MMPGSGCQGNEHSCVDVFIRPSSVFAVEPRTVVGRGWGDSNVSKPEVMCTVRVVIIVSNGMLLHGCGCYIV